MKRFITFLMLLLLTCVITAAAATPLLVDNADLLTQSEEETLLASLQTTSRELDMDVVVVTVDSLEGKTAQAYADDYFDYNGYGPDGVLLLVSMSEREWHISTTGTAIDLVTNREVSQIGDRIVSHLGSGAYLNAFLTFNSEVRKAATQQSEGASAYKNPIGWFVCVGLGILAGLITVLIMKGQLKSVRSQHAAANYVVPNSFSLTGSHDTFLFQNTTRTPRPQNNGGGTHPGSSGRSHGGGGGRF